MKTRDYATAAAVLEEHIRQQPKDQRGWLQLLECYERAGSAKLGDAIKVAHTALPESEAIATVRCRWLASQGREFDALEALPLSAPSAMRLQLLERLGRDEEAIAFALAQIRHGFDPELFTFAVDKLIGAGRAAEAEQLARSAPPGARTLRGCRVMIHALSLARGNRCKTSSPDQSLAALAQFIDQANLTVLDVGGRGGDLGALATFAPFIDYVACEPEETAHERLAAAARTRAPWRSVEVSPYALGRDDGPAQLYVTAKGGLSSIFEPDDKMFAAVGMADRAQVKRKSPINLRRLATLVAGNEIRAPDILKLDVQGAELDVIEGAGTALSSVGAILLEMEYRGFYKGQPLFTDLDATLQERGFELIDFDVSRLADVDRGLAYSRPRPVWSHALYVARFEPLNQQSRRAVAAAVALIAFYQFALARAMIARITPENTQLLIALDHLREHAATISTAKEIAAAKLFTLPALTALWPRSGEALP